jgi:cold shock CspA family protein
MDDYQNIEEKPPICQYPKHTYYHGQVKWFNSRIGYGYITCSDTQFLKKVGIDETENKEGEIFVHTSSLSVNGNCKYKSLKTGEYVSFYVLHNPSAKYPYSANDVTGIDRGKLMCEVVKGYSGEYKKKYTSKKYTSKKIGKFENPI